MRGEYDIDSPFWDHDLPDYIALLGAWRENIIVGEMILARQTHALATAMGAKDVDFDRLRLFWQSTQTQRPAEKPGDTPEGAMLLFRRFRLWARAFAAAQPR